MNIFNTITYSQFYISNFKHTLVYSRNLLKVGSSKPWPEVMKELTGQSKMDATAILDYFKPLQQWLEEQNKGEEKGKRKFIISNGMINVA